MGRLIVTSFAFLFDAIAIIFTLSATILPHWMRDDPTSVVVERSYTSKGLWKACTWEGDAKNTRDCKDYNKIILELPIPVIGGRILTIFALIFGVVSMTAGIISSDCVLFWKKPQYRCYMHYVASVCSILAACCIGTAVGWYARLVVNQLWMGKNASRQVFGDCLTFGVIGFVFHLIAGICFIFAKSEIWETEKKFLKLQKHNPTLERHAYANLNQASNDIDHTTYVAPNARSTGPIIVADTKSGFGIPKKTNFDSRTNITNGSAENVIQYI